MGYVSQFYISVVPVGPEKTVHKEDCKVTKPYFSQPHNFCPQCGVELSLATRHVSALLNLLQTKYDTVFHNIENGYCTGKWYDYREELSKATKDFTGAAIVCTRVGEEVFEDFGVPLDIVTTVFYNGESNDLPRIVVQKPDYRAEIEALQAK